MPHINVTSRYEGNVGESFKLHGTDEILLRDLSTQASNCMEKARLLQKMTVLTDAGRKKLVEPAFQQAHSAMHHAREARLCVVKMVKLMATNPKSKMVNELAYQAEFEIVEGYKAFVKCRELLAVILGTG
jgi:hypothetical protein